MSRDSQDTNDRFRHSLDLPFPLVGDPQGAISKAWGVRWPVIGMSRRVTYVVGRDRKVKLVHSSELDAESHVAQACAFASTAGRR